MNIFIGTDSRGSYHKQGRVTKGWTTDLQINHPEHVFVCQRAGIEKPLTTLFDIENKLSQHEDGFFDLAIIQVGYHEGVEYYSRDAFELFFEKNFNPQALVIDPHNRYFKYWDESAFKRVFDLAKKKAKRVVHIGFHSLHKYHKGQLTDNAILSNETLSKLATDYLELPQDNDWGPTNTFDQIHYNEGGRNYILERIEEYIRQLSNPEYQHTLTSVFISQSSNPSSKNSWLYTEAMTIGRAIAEQTKPGEVILLAKKSGVELYAAFMGAIIFGRTPLIIQRPSPKVHQSFFERRMSDLKSQVNANLCFCESQDNEKFSAFFQCLNSLVPKEEKKPEVHIPRLSDLAFIQLSSGTTGVSKICEITHGQIVKHCRAYGKVIGMNSSKSVVSWLPLYHDMGLIAAFLLPVVHGAEFHVIDPFDWLMNPKSLLELSSTHKGTHCWMPSFAFKYLANKVSIESVPEVQLSSMEQLISCSEPTFCDDLKKFGKKFQPIGFNPSSLQTCYALAENIFAVSQTKTLGETEWKGVKYANCGNVLPDVSVKIIRDGHDVTNTDDGEIWIKSPFMPRTNKCVDGWYNTGDIGFFSNDCLHIIGRAKDMFVSYGVNIYPETIEHVIANVDGVVPGRVVCFGVFSKEQGTNKVVVCAETEDVTNNKLKMELSAIIKEEFGLAAIVILVTAGSLIKTSSGKFCRIKNKETYGKINA